MSEKHNNALTVLWSFTIVGAFALMMWGWWKQDERIEKIRKN